MIDFAENDFDELGFRALCSKIDTNPSWTSTLTQAASQWTTALRNLRCRRQQFTYATQSPCWSLVRSLDLDFPNLSVLASANRQTDFSNLHSVRCRIFSDSDVDVLEQSLPMDQLHHMAIEMGFEPSLRSLRTVLFSPKLTALAALDVSVPNVGIQYFAPWTALCEYLASTAGSAVRRLGLTWPPPDILQQLISQMSNRLNDLKIWRLDPSGLTALCTAGSATLRSLDLTDNQLGDQGLATLCACRAFSALEALNLSYNNIGSKGVGKLKDSAYACNLRSLDLSGNPIGDMGLQILSKISFAQLEHLYLSSTSVTARGVESLLASPNLRHLQSLCLDDNEIGKVCSHSLFFSECLESLRRLTIRGATVAAATLEKLASCAFSTHLVELALAACQIVGKVDEQTISGINGCPRLRQLDLSHCHIGDEGARAIGQHNWKRLRFLNLNRTGIGNDGAKALAESSGLSPLWWLVLSNNDGFGWNNNGIGDEGIQAIGHSEALTNLVELDLNSCATSDVSTQFLVDSPVLAGLDKILFGRCDKQCGALLQSKNLRPLARGFVEYLADS